MASVTKLGQGKKPPRAVDFVNHLGKRNRLRLGVVSHEDAMECRRFVEKLVNAKRLNHSPERSTIEWIAGINDELHERLSQFGLIESRTSKSTVPTVGEWIKKYLEQRRRELAAGSIERLTRTGKRLEAFFGSKTRLDELTPAGAADWRAAMLAEMTPAKKGEEQKPRLSETTIRNHSRDAKTIFNAAVDREIISRNPFAKLKSSVLSSNRSRYVGPDEAAAVLEECHTVAWRCLFGLARFAGLRTPSETHRVTWADVNWERRLLTVYASKTKMSRIVPITADLFPILQAAFDEASDGAVNIVKLGSHRSNLHRGMEKIIERAGLVPWEDLFQTLRCSAETDFARKYPQHEVSRWLGHSMKVSEKHYLMSDDRILESVTSAPAMLRVAESAAEGSRNDQKPLVLAGRDRLKPETIISPLNEENPCKTRVFDSSEGGTRTRDPRLMKPVL